MAKKIKIISWNVNGLRSVYRKGFLQIFKKIDADIFCLQEIKVQANTIPAELKDIFGYYSYFNFAQKPGYSGVAIYSKEKPLKISSKIGLDRFDNEGRLLRLDFKDFILLNVYLPHGGRQKQNLEYKLRAYKELLALASEIKGKKVVIAGDFNVAHEEIDLARPKNNQKNIMFTPKERQQLDGLVEMQFTDTFRKFNKEGGNYTWWPWLANARIRNIGWRIDYIFVSQKFLASLKKAYILKEVMGSDHCPVVIEKE